MTGLYNSASAYDLATVTFDGGAAGDLTNLPVLGVFIAFDNDPYDADPDWEEITSYVRDVSISRGRNDDYSQFPAGTASLTLNNRNRVFDPFNTSSPYAGKLLPRKQIKIVAQANGSNYTIFRGYCAGFPVKWVNNGADTITILDCFDLFGLMAATELPLDWSYQVITDLNPIDYYRLDEPEGVVEFANSGQNPRPLPINPFGLYQSSKQSSLAPQLKFEAWDVQAYKSVFPAYTTTTSNFSCCWWVRNSQQYTSAAGSSIANFGCGQYGFNMFGVFMPTATASNSYVYLKVLDYHNGWLTFGTLATQFYNDLPQHFAVVTNATGIPNVYVNGQQVPFTVTSQTTVTGTPSSSDAQDYMAFNKGTFQEIAVFNYQLTADQVALIYGASATGYEETSAARAQRIMDTTSVDAALYDITTEPVATVSDFGSTDNFALTELQTIADSEGGEIFVDRNGVIQFVNRWYAFGSPTSAVVQATFGESDIHYSDTFEILYDADSIRNKVAVSVSNNALVEVSDQASVSAYGISDATINTRLSSIEQGQALAQLEATVSAVLKPSISPIQVGTTRIDAEWATILGLDVLHRIVVERTPPTGTPITQTMLINQLTYNLTPSEWRVGITGSARLTGWFTADYSLTDGSDVVL